MRVFASPEELRSADGECLGASDWLVVDQARIDAFAEVTGDHQWIHVDVERAASGPFGGTVAHGYLTLALFPLLTRQIVAVEGTRLTVNYGLNRVRFVSPVRAGSRVRARSKLVAVSDIAEGIVQIVMATTIDIEEHDRPACVAELVTRFYY